MTEQLPFILTSDPSPREPAAATPERRNVRNASGEVTVPAGPGAHPDAGKAPPQEPGRTARSAGRTPDDVAPAKRNRAAALPDAAPVERNGPAAERDIYTVSRLNREVRLLLERGIPLIWLEGELSNFSAPASGHWYFSLKDREAQIRCAMFKSQNARVGFTPKAGQHVLVRGRVTMYEARGDYQLIAEHMEEAGVGALRREFERLKTKLAAEGLFAKERKRELPRFPRRIGVVTSPTGAAIRDILHILARRFPPAEIIVYPCAVQGAAAAPSIVRALHIANERSECDVLIVARGGGSLEDLWAFNDERVARAIHASRLPVVSGVGHEIDFTIADFVADVRAPTPSGAAEIVVPDRQACLDVLARTADRLLVAMRRELRAFTSRFEVAASRLKVMHPGARLMQQAQRLDDLEQRMTTGIRRELRMLAARFDAAATRLRLTSPEMRLARQRERLSDLEQRLLSSMRGTLQKDRSRMSDAFARLLRHSPERRIREICRTHDGLESRLHHAWQTCFARAEHRLTLAVRTLHTMSPLATLERGFAIVTRPSDGTLVTDVSSLAAGDEIEARVSRGKFRATVTSKELTDEPTKKEH